MSQVRSLSGRPPLRGITTPPARHRADLLMPRKADRSLGPDIRRSVQVQRMRKETLGAIVLDVVPPGRPGSYDADVDVAPLGLDPECVERILGLRHMCSWIGSST